MSLSEDNTFEFEDCFNPDNANWESYNRFKKLNSVFSKLCANANIRRNEVYYNPPIIDSDSESKFPAKVEKSDINCDNNEFNYYLGLVKGCLTRNNLDEEVKKNKIKEYSQYINYIIETNEDDFTDYMFRYKHRQNYDDEDVYHHYRDDTEYWDDDRDDDYEGLYPLSNGRGTDDWEEYYDSIYN